MKKIDLAQTIQLLANVGVIAGIVFLAVELRQNNDLLGTQVRRDRLVSRSAPTALELNTVNIASLDYKTSIGEALSDQEEFGLRLFAVYNFFTWEWQYDEYRAGTIDLENLPIGGWRIVAGRSPVWQEAWRGYSAAPERSADFVSFIEENVFGNVD